jgi:hypothetical protein
MYRIFRKLLILHGSIIDDEETVHEGKTAKQQKRGNS